jgi:hypothetical protein
MFINVTSHHGLFGWDLVRVLIQVHGKNDFIYGMDDTIACLNIGKNNLGTVFIVVAGTILKNVAILFTNSPRWFAIGHDQQLSTSVGDVGTIKDLVGYGMKEENI